MGAIPLVLVLALVGVVVAPPPKRAAAEEAKQEDHAQQAGDATGNAQHQYDGQRSPYEFTYSKYLEEVVKVLESDPKFNDKLKSMNEQDIRAGNIADHMDEVDSGVFDRLHKLKFAELERLRETVAKQVEADGGAHNIKLPEHLDLVNWEKFTKEDLRMLIKKTVADMEEIDRQRKQDFKSYEMAKKAEEDHKLAQMNEEERQKAVAEAEAAKQRHNEHEKLKHPGSRDQLEEVWEDTDQMDKDSFDPRTFFNLHDLNGDGFWNAEELEALFQLELEKMYNETNPDDDPKEKMEEMYRMREHVVQQMDKNNDRLISLDEFLSDTEAQTPDKDPGWQDLGQQQVYTDEELKRFEEEYAKQQGWGADAYEPHPPAHPPPPPPAGQQPIQPIVHRGVDPAAQAPAGQAVHPPGGQAPPPNPPGPADQHPQAPAVPQYVPPAVDHPPIHDIPKDPTYGI